MVWSGFDNLEGALGGAGKYDPSQAPSRLANLRDPIYTATWKPLKNWRLEPGFERVGRVKVASENLNAFVAAMSKLEKGVQDAGHPNFFNGVFISIGVGKTLTDKAFMHLTGESVSIDTLTYDFTSGGYGNTGSSNGSCSMRGVV